MANLSAELEDKVAEADAEWRKIDRELVRWSGAELAGGAIGLGPAIAHGGAQLAAGALAVAGIANLISSAGQRSEFKIKYPAGFFARLKKEHGASD